MTRWFVIFRKRQPKSDNELLTAYLASHFEAHGQRESRVSSNDVRRKLKTMRNELSIARRIKCQQWRGHHADSEKREA